MLVDTCLSSRSVILVILLKMNSDEIFNSKVSESKTSVNSYRITTEEHYNKIIKELLEAKTRKVKTSTDYGSLKRYDALKVGETNKLILPMGESQF